jgi:hypothetical protein
MTVQLVPTFNSPSYSQTTTLEGISFLFSFIYSQREDCWYLSIADANGVDVYNGIKLIVGNPLLFKCVDPRRPPGELCVLSGTTDLSPPGLNDLIADSGRCQLWYTTSDVLQMLGAGTIGEYIAQLQSATSQGQQSTYGET